MVEKIYPKIDRRTALKALGVGGSVASLPVLASKKASASSNITVMLAENGRYNEKWDSNNNDLDKWGCSGYNPISCIAGWLDQLWRDYIIKDGNYNVEFDYGDAGTLSPDAFGNSDHLYYRAMNADNWMQERHTGWNPQAYEDYDAFIILDWNYERHKPLGDVGWTYGTAGSSNGKTSVIDMAFFEDAKDEFDPDNGFYQDTGLEGTAFRVAGELFYATYSDSTSTYNNNLSLMAKADRKGSADCGYARAEEKQERVVSGCARDNIRSYIDSNF